MRSFVLNEPRGGVFRHVNLLIPPKDPRAQMGWIIMEPEGTPPMSGSNAIRVATVLLETGILPETEPETHLVLEAPAERGRRVIAWRTRGRVVDEQDSLVEQSGRHRHTEGFMILGWPKRRDIYDRDEQAVYLTRWFLLGTHMSWLALMLHKMHQPDDDSCHHDHPWSFLTLVLRGGYIEEMTAADGSVRTLHNRPGRIRYRGAEHTHRVHRLPRGSCYTLVLRFRWRREWGFHTPEGWVHWKRFIDLRGAVAWCDGWERRRS